MKRDYESAEKYVNGRKVNVSPRPWPRSRPASGAVRDLRPDVPWVAGRDRPLGELWEIRVAEEKVVDDRASVFQAILILYYLCYYPLP